MGARELMLSRLAENLFWIGRYLERAENTARLLDVTYHGVLEVGSDRTPSEVWSELADTLFLSDEIPDLGDTGGEEIGELLIADEDHPGSLVSITGQARENARTSREWLSAEVWEALNDLYLGLTRHDLAEAAQNRPYEVLSAVRSSCQAVDGAVDASMPRSDAYRYFIAGQRIERALITTRVLGVWHQRLGGFASSAAFAEWVKLLKSVSAYEAYLRAHRASMEGERVLAFLLQSPELPRSVLHCLMTIESHVGRLESGKAGDDVRRKAVRLRADVEFARIDLAGPQLEHLLDSIEEAITDLIGEIERAFFRPTNLIHMHTYEAF